MKANSVSLPFLFFPFSHFEQEFLKENNNNTDMLLKA